MSKTRFYNFTDAISNDIDSRRSISNNTNNDENNEDNDDDSEFLQDIPYSSSSLDRSSIGSIPWADDAIKQNQLDWEQVERMLIGEEPLPEEQDLRNEILEWQQKFPILLERKNVMDLSEKKFSKKDLDNPQTGESRTLNLVDDLVSHLSLNSSDEDDRYDELDTPTAVPQRFDNFGDHILVKRSPTKKSYLDRLSAKMSLLRVTALPLHTSQHIDAIKASPQQISTKRENSGTSNSLHIQKQHKNKVFEPQQRFRMPPILNVLESRRRFRNLTSNKSFVQLTHVKPSYAKSAAVIRQSASNLPIGLQTRATPIFTSHHQDVWQKPLLATRVSSNFFNNRNTIILPSLNTQRVTVQQGRNSTTSSTGAGSKTHSFSNSNFASSPSSSADIDLQPQYAASRFVSRWQQINAHHTSTSTGTVSTGRSISAAVHHHPRTDTGFGELYMPYNAYKQDGFK
ncbi:uncharacterized protein LOC129236076 [Anastrepha obliqua]|uniref:uncharacterized protein LOC129236076 n=1 Tax=Anastrepha obliqua TaxID=95512 RepID=UPI0024092EBE|nr:uncharacterized protein LOC129236076 [Anastrepha obliqua]